MTDEEKRFDRREEARLDDMYDAQYEVDTAFNRWWNADGLVEDNPYTRDTPAFWAWEGWQAGVAAEREACAKVAEDTGNISGNMNKTWRNGCFDAAFAIRERGAP